MSALEPNAAVMPSLKNTSTSPSFNSRESTVGRTASRMPRGSDSLSKISVCVSVSRKARGEPIFTMSARPLSKSTAAVSMQAKFSSRPKASSRFTVESTASPESPAR